MTDEQKKAFWYFYPFWQPYKKWVYLNVGNVLLLSCLGIVDPLAVMFVFDQVFGSKDAGLLLIVVGLVLLVQLLRRYLTFIRDITGRYLEGRVQHDIREHVFGRYIGVRSEHLGTKSVGDHLWRLGQDVDKTQQLISQTIPSIIETAADLVLLLLLAFFIDKTLCLIAVAIVPVFVGLGYLSFTKIAGFEKSVQEAESATNAVAKEILAGADDVKINNAIPRQSLRYLRSVASKLRAQAVGGASYSLAALGIDAAVILWSCLITGLAGYKVIEDEITIGQYIAITAYLLKIFSPLSTLSKTYQTAIWQLSSAERVLEMLELPAEGKAEGERPEEIGDIRLVDVSFRYLDRGADSLSGINLTIAKGCKIALVGPIGCGKSTLVKLLMRLQDPSAGSILAGNIGYDRIDRAWLRGRIGMVLQRPSIFDASILDNIRLGNPKLSRQDIVFRLKAIGLYDYFMEMEGGLDRRTGEEGAFLSGGQRQLVAIARAYVKDHEVLIFDEATAALDSFTERIVNRSIEVLMRGKTSIIIAHRLSSISGVDSIVFMRDGKISEQGTMEELLRRKGDFYDLYRSFYSGQRILGLDQDAPAETDLIDLWASEDSHNELDFGGKVSFTKRYNPIGEICVDLDGSKGYCADRCFTKNVSEKLRKHGIQEIAMDIFVPEKTPVGWGKTILFGLVAQTQDDPWVELGQSSLVPGSNYARFRFDSKVVPHKLVFVFTSGEVCRGPVYISRIQGATGAGVP